MKFTKTEADENYPILKLKSETGLWEVGLMPVIFGVRVRAGIADSCGVSIDYCAGADFIFQLELLACIVDILESFPEEILPYEIEKILPRYKRRPINLDPCWDQLKQLREQLQQSHTVQKV